MSASDDEIPDAVAQNREHSRQAGFVMLKVAIQDRDKGGVRRKNAFHDGRRQTSSADAADAAHSRVAQSETSSLVGGSVRAIIVDEDHLPGEADQGLRQPRHHHGNVSPLVVAGYDDRIFRNQPIIEALWHVTDEHVCHVFILIVKR